MRMDKAKWLALLETYVVAIAGGFLFYITGLPIPWILGPLTAMIVWRNTVGRSTYSPTVLRNGALSVLGIYFGLTITATTFTSVIHYIVPFLLATSLLIVISIGNSLLLCRIMKIDLVTSVFGLIPGGLSEMVAASESLRANVAMVTLLQTVRLLTVVFLVPFIVVHLFFGSTLTAWDPASEPSTVSGFHYAWFIFPIILGWLLRNIIPASYMIGPLVATALLNGFSIPLPNIPIYLFIFAQVSMGVYMGKSFSMEDLRRGRKWVGLISLVTILLIFSSFALGFGLTLITDLSLSTAILSVAPGGMVEMTLTATAVGADASIVMSLQLVRVLFIILFIPSLLAAWFRSRWYQEG